MLLEPVELESDTVKLIPLTMEHIDQLIAAAEDGELWRLWFTSVPNAQDMKKYVSDALAQQQEKQALVFVVLHKTTNKIIGCTRFCNIDLTNKRLEIGYTWYSKSYQKTSVNTECKLLLLKHAFEVLNVIAVEFRTHWHNQASRNAIARLGAKQDGVLRNHQIMADGSFRDTVIFSIINNEWSAVKPV